MRMTRERLSRAGSCGKPARRCCGPSPTSAHVRRSAIALLALTLFPSCHNTSSVAPTPPPAVRPNVAIQSISVAGETASAKVYRVVLHLRETAGAAATIAAVDLAFLKDTTPVTSSHYDQPLPSTVTAVPAGGRSTRESS
jgi:hypothetical protein